MPLIIKKSQQVLYSLTREGHYGLESRLKGGLKRERKTCTCLRMAHAQLFSLCLSLRTAGIQICNSNLKTKLGGNAQKHVFHTNRSCLYFQRSFAPAPKNAKADLKHMLDHDNCLWIFPEGSSRGRQRVP